jgi:hypothetical protein
LATRPPYTKYDQLRVLYRTLLVFATVGTLILVIGLVQFAYLEPIGQSTGVKAHIQGIYEYDPATGTTKGNDRSEFPRAGQFAAVVDWTSLPNNLVVDARWYDSFGSLRGQVGPAHPQNLTEHSTIPVDVPPDLHYVLPGRYTFVVERIQNDQPVEVLARRFVHVDRS